MPFIRILTALSAALLCAQEASAADAVRVKSATLLDITGPTTDVFADAASSESLTIPVAICSCITFRGQTRDGALLFDGITDRGPNTTAPKVRRNGELVRGRYFADPAFPPQIVRLRVKDGKAVVFGMVPLSDNEGQPVSTVPPVNYSEVAMTIDNKILKPGRVTLDPEGMAAVRKGGGWWIADEYGPSLCRFNSLGEMMRCYAPGSGLPQIYGAHRVDRGFESVSVMPDGRVLGVMQGALPGEHFVRALIFDEKKRVSEQYAWPLEKNFWKNPDDVKIGDIASLGNDRFLLIEQGEAKTGQWVTRLVPGSLKGVRAIDKLSPQKLAALKPRTRGMVAKKVIMTLENHGWSAKKAEGLAVLPDRKTIAVVSDNEFGIDVKAQSRAGRAHAPQDYVREENGAVTHLGNPSDAQFKFVPRTDEGAETQMMLIELAKPL